MQPTVSPASLPVAATSLAASQIWQGILRRPTVVDLSTRVHANANVEEHPSLAVHQAMGELITILQTLALADSGWPVDKPRTPETLLPYVSDEVTELLEALSHAQQADGVDTGASLSSDSEDVNLELIADLGAYLVWCLAASSPETMQLLEGLSLPVELPTQGETLQGVRLVPVLTLKLDNQRYALDLVTQTVFESDTALPDDGQRSHPNPTVDKPMLSLAEWRHQLWTKAIAHTPELQEWCTEQRLHVLLPGQGWCEAQTSLNLHFVPFGSDAWVAALADMNAGLEKPPLLSAATPLPSGEFLSLALDTQLMFVDRDWYCEAIATSLGTAMGTQLETQSPDTTDNTASALTILYQAHQVLFQDLNALDRPPILPPSLSLTHLCTYIQWLWIRADRALMAWMSGIPIKHLKLGNDWQSGTLVATNQLEFSQDGDIVGVLEVGTGHWQSEHPPAPEDSILQLQKPLTPNKTLWQLADLQAHLEACLRQRSPLLAHLMTGTAVQLTPPDIISSPLSANTCGQMRLQVTLTFYPFV